MLLFSGFAPAIIVDQCPFDKFNANEDATSIAKKIYCYQWELNHFFRIKPGRAITSAISALGDESRMYSILIQEVLKMKKLLFTTAFLLSAMAAFSAMANDSIDADDFIEEASAKGLAEIESGRMALDKSSSPEVRSFAQKMIDDHAKANKELATIARNKNLEIADDAELLNQAKAFILRLRDGESFDEAYANNQVSAHESTIELFRKASRSKDREIKAFADKTLTKLENHLRMARELVEITQTTERNTQMDVGTVPPTQHSE